ncbi:hypothetical protein [Streptomyces sp. SP18CS02]|uniref:hypothetical protein n=1 Tax=Streptomyces sp. SP18CS02 TaxID=3002531 RepID=UPI002E772915|nr:hypothetical protein [Streptomyces sp. SP18CS02]MEE1751180.1 hypothetical protein [Streptomyces sp. SP18CS02]
MIDVMAVELRHELAVGRAGGSEVVVTALEFEFKVDVLLFGGDDAGLELFGVIGSADDRLAPNLLGGVGKRAGALSEHREDLAAGDGNNRMVSMWLARAGGDIEEAISACTASVLGSIERSGWRSRAEQTAARRRVGKLTARTRKNLATPTPTEATRRDGHTLAFPATVVVGAQADEGQAAVLADGMSRMLARDRLPVRHSTD